MSRGSSGRDEETWATLTGFRLCDADAGPGEDEDGCGVTVGNRPVRFGGVTVVPGTGIRVPGGSVVGGNVGTGVEVGVGLAFRATAVVTDASAGESDVPLTVTVKVIGAPGLAFRLTLSVTFSSSA